MDEQKRANLSALFDALVELPPEERAAGLAAIADDELRRELSSLLAHAGDGDTLAQQAIEWGRKAIGQRDPGFLVRYGILRGNPAMQTVTAALAPIINLPG